jgi:adenylate kinase
MRRVFALTGTPGTGKTVAARHLSRSRPDLLVLEVADIARTLGCARGPRGSKALTVDVEKLSAALPEEVRRLDKDLVLVGHLSHLLPVRRILLLRCDPRILQVRLASRGDPERTRRENLECEFLDFILFESLSRRVPVHELDTSRLRPEQVACWISRVISGQVPPHHGKVDWIREAGGILPLGSGGASTGREETTPVCL